MKPVKLNQADIDTAMLSIPPYFSQAQRMLQYLGRKPNSITVDVNRECATGNLSDVARKTNPYILKHGLFIACQRPVIPINNRFNEPSSMFLWGVYSLPLEAANDGHMERDSDGKFK